MFFLFTFASISLSGNVAWLEKESDASICFVALFAHSLEIREKKNKMAKSAISRPSLCSAITMQRTKEIIIAGIVTNRLEREKECELLILFL